MNWLNKISQDAFNDEYMKLCGFKEYNNELDKSEKIAHNAFVDELEKISQDDLGGKLHEEREKRIKLEELPKECNKIDPIIIRQGIMSEVKKDGNVIAYSRVRMKREPGKKAKYSVGIKHFPLKQETEAEISVSLFNVFYPKNIDRPQEKNRYSLKNGWDVDQEDNGKIVAEYEHGKGEKIIVPKHWKIKQEK